jgi:hypothetical protein
MICRGRAWHVTTDRGQWVSRHALPANACAYGDTANDDDSTSTPNNRHPIESSQAARGHCYYPWSASCAALSRATAQLPVHFPILHIYQTSLCSVSSGIAMDASLHSASEHLIHRVIHLLLDIVVSNVSIAAPIQYHQMMPWASDRSSIVKQLFRARSRERPSFPGRLWLFLSAGVCQCLVDSLRDKPAILRHFLHRTRFIAGMHTCTQAHRHTHTHMAYSCSTC